MVQVTFMPYRIVLKDERRTSNIERPTSKEKGISNTEHSTPIFVSCQPFDSAQGREPVEQPLLYLAMKILISTGVFYMQCSSTSFNRPQWRTRWVRLDFFSFLKYC